MLSTIKQLIRLFKAVYLGPFYICMGIGGGGSGGASSSQPLTAKQRSDIYQGAINDFASSSPDLFKVTETPAQGDPYMFVKGVPGILGRPGTQDKWVANPNYVPAHTSIGLNAPQYTSPSYQSPGEAKTLTGQDYDALQAALTSGYEAPLDYAKGQDVKSMNQDLANRGIWSSGLAEQATKDLDAVYAPQYAQAGANATNARYGLQSSEDQMLNQYALQNAGQQNTFNLANAGQTYQSQWAPLNYLQGIWNGTGGAISNGGSGGWNFSI